MSDIVDVNVVDEMKQAYGDYALAVLVGRAIPDLYDGLKPVTRRVLVAMKWLGLRPDGRFMKAARVEGETMGKLHPHGGAYGAMVTASQSWTNNATLVDGWGNWGSPTDGPAAARYTEAKLTEYAYSILLQDSDTWQLKDNYDGSLQEPTQLNATVPNVLVNGGEGIGVGYATRIPTHNLQGIAKALETGEGKHLVPDFPTGCDVVKDDGLVEYLNTGRGSIRMRARCEQTEVQHGKRATRPACVFTNLPIHISTEQVGQQIKTAVEQGRITTVADVRDETDREGIRLVVIGKASASASAMEEELFRYTSLDNKFGANNLVIDGVKPVQLPPMGILTKWLEWRDGRLVVAIKSELAAKRGRLEICQGLLGAIDLMEDIVEAIRRSKDRTTARANLCKKFQFKPSVADAILDMRLSQLTRMDESKLKTEIKELTLRIRDLVKLNSSKARRKEFIVSQVKTAGHIYGNARRSATIEAPTETIVVSKKVIAKASGPRPRFLSVDTDKGILTQSKKLPRKGGMVIDSTDKLIVLTDDGLVRKVASTFKGPLASSPVKILAMNKLSLASTAQLLVFKLDDAIYGTVMTWEALAKTTSKGKRFLPEGAEVIHVGGGYTLKKKGRKKDLELTTNTWPPKAVGSKGRKLAKIDEVLL